MKARHRRNVEIHVAYDGSRDPAVYRGEAVGSYGFYRSDGFEKAGTRCWQLVHIGVGSNLTQVRTKASALKLARRLHEVEAGRLSRLPFGSTLPFHDESVNAALADLKAAIHDHMIADPGAPGAPR